ncbi:MAG: formate dehydrogenase subunit delta [Hyphomicrobium sp.]
MQSADKLVMMVNQIAKNLAVRGEENAVHSTAEHIKKFWDPRMRKAILDHLKAGGQGLQPLAKRAVEKLSVVHSSSI